MANYYDEILEEIEDLISRNENEEALFLIRKELNMPYVPSDFEQKFKELRSAVTASIQEKKDTKEASLDSLLRNLRGSESAQIAAASALSQRNLRDCIMEIRMYLANEPCPEAAALIMEAIAEQEIKEDFRLVTNGIEADFYGDSLIPVAKSGGFRKAYACLKKWLENDNPGMLEMCRTLLTRQVFMALPLSYDADEGEDLALGVLEEVSGMMDGGLTYRQIRAKESSF